MGTLDGYPFGSGRYGYGPFGYGEDDPFVFVPITSAITFAASDQPRTYAAGDTAGDGYDARDRAGTYAETDTDRTYDGSTP